MFSKLGIGRTYFTELDGEPFRVGRRKSLGFCLSSIHILPWGNRLYILLFLSPSLTRSFYGGTHTAYLRMSRGVSREHPSHDSSGFKHP
eukprot:7627597-Pyramimonas_sp.AAC.1